MKITKLKASYVAVNWGQLFLYRCWVVTRSDVTLGKSRKTPEVDAWHDGTTVNQTKGLKDDYKCFFYGRNLNAGERRIYFLNYCFTLIISLKFNTNLKYFNYLMVNAPLQTKFVLLSASNYFASPVKSGCIYELN